MVVSPEEGSLRFSQRVPTKSLASQARGTKRVEPTFVDRDHEEIEEIKEIEEDEEMGEGAKSTPLPEKSKARPLAKAKGKAVIPCSKKTKMDSSNPEFVKFMHQMWETHQQSSMKCGRMMDAFTDKIVRAPIQKGKPPQIETYDGSTNAKCHMGRFEGQMTLFSSDEDVMCKILAGTFTGKALSWMLALRPKSIKNYNQFRHIFLNSYVGAGEPTRPKTNLIRIKQTETETTKSYIIRLRKMSEQIVDLSESDIQLCFEGGLSSSFLKMNFASNRPKNVEEIYERASAIASAEEPNEPAARRPAKDRIDQVK